MSNLVSILLPVYNGQKYLKSAIDSVLAQTHQDFELLACDDCSTDDSYAILEECAAADERIKIVRNQTQQGLFGNYNQCWQRAQGTLIKPFAQDDILYPQYLAEGVKTLAQNSHIKLMLSARNLIDENGATLETVSPLPAGLYKGEDLITWSLIFLTNKLGEPVTGMFRAADLDYGYDTRYFHYGDLELWFRLLSQGDLSFNDQVLCAFRRHEGGTTTANHRHLFDLIDAMRICRQYYSYLEKIGETKEHLYRRLVEYAALSVAHLTAETGGNESMVRRHGAEPGPNCGINADDDFAELLYLSLAYITPLMAELDHAKGCLTELEGLRAQMNSRSHQAVGWLMTSLRRGR